MIVEGELDCPRCGMEIDPDLDDWMMRDGESRAFRCDGCGTVVEVTACVRTVYTAAVRP